MAAKSNADLEAAAADRERVIAAIQTIVLTALMHLDKCHQTVQKYEREIDNLLRELQQGKHYQKTAEIQAKLQFIQMECNSLQKCPFLSRLKTECALRAEKELLKAHHAALRSENEAVLQKQKQLEEDHASLRATVTAQNVELSNSAKALERSKQEFEKRLAALQLQHQQDSTKLQTRLDEANSRNNSLQREKPWMTWRLAVAGAVTGVIAAVLFRT